MEQKADLYLEVQSKDFYLKTSIEDEYEITLPNGTVVSLLKEPKAEPSVIKEESVGQEGQEKDNANQEAIIAIPRKKEWLTISQVAKILKTSYKAIYSQIYIGKLEASRINNRLHISRDELERFKMSYEYRRRTNPKEFEGSIKCATRM